ncbi:MAG: DUF4827 domain-containing protein [Prevotella sp.]|jgi:hypothetical protein
MRKTAYLIFMMIGLAFIVSCSDEETYADQVERERKAIQKYIADSAVTVISEDEFAANNYTTDLSSNEWVLFESSGVYMQVVREGTGEKLADGETATVLCRYVERNLLTDSITASNMNAYYAGMVDKMSVTNSSGTFTGYFVSGSSSLMDIYSSSSTAVPEGWRLPLSYIKLGRQSTEDGEIAKVRLIVPHEMGHSVAIYNVTPYLYDITYERGR